MYEISESHHTRLAARPVYPLLTIYPFSISAGAPFSHLKAGLAWGPDLARPVTRRELLSEIFLHHLHALWFAYLDGAE